MKKLNEMFTARSTMFATVLVLVLLAALISMGLLTPFIIRLTTGDKILLDEAYFNRRSALPTLALVGLLTLCLMRGAVGKKESLAVLGLGILGAGASAFLSPFSNTPVDIAFPLLAAALFAVIYRLLSSRGQNPVGTLRKASSHIIHLGVVLLLIGILFSTNMNQEDSAIIEMGNLSTFDSMGYSVRITDISSGIEGNPYGGYSGSAYVSTIYFDVYRWGWLFDHGEVKYISDFKWEQSYTETYIHRGLLDELFIAPKAVDTKKQTVDLYVRKVPFMTALWGGFYLMVIGITLLFISDSLSGSTPVFGPEISKSKNRKGSK